jgi:hypothetical protein
MSVKTWRALIAAACVVGMLAAVEPAPAQDEAGAMPFEFEGKFLAVTLKSNKDLTHALKALKLRKIGNQLFVVGTGLDTGSGQKDYVGLSVWLALNDVSEIQVYATHAALKKAFVPDGDEPPLKKPPKN